MSSYSNNMNNNNSLVSTPLLLGLASSSTTTTTHHPLTGGTSSTATALVHEALADDRAAARLQRMWRQQSSLVRNRSQDGTATTTTTTTTITTTATATTKAAPKPNHTASPQQQRSFSHWLWRSRTSYSAVERAAATRLLLQACHDSTTTTTHTMDDTVDAVLRQLHVWQASPPGRCLVEWSALVGHLQGLSSAVSVSSCEQTKEEDESTTRRTTTTTLSAGGTPYHQQPPPSVQTSHNHGVVAGRLWRHWPALCQRLYHAASVATTTLSSSSLSEQRAAFQAVTALAELLSRTCHTTVPRRAGVEPTHDTNTTNKEEDSDDNDDHETPSETSAPTTTRGPTTALDDVDRQALERLFAATVWSSTPRSHPARCTNDTTTNNNHLSPLACLVGATGWMRQGGQSVDVLERLVHPETVCQVTMIVTVDDDDHNNDDDDDEDRVLHHQVYAVDAAATDPSVAAPRPVLEDTGMEWTNTVAPLDATTVAAGTEPTTASTGASDEWHSHDPPQDSHDEEEEDEDEAPRNESTDGTVRRVHLAEILKTESDGFANKEKNDDAQGNPNEAEDDDEAEDDEDCEMEDCGDDDENGEEGGNSGELVRAESMNDSSDESEVDVFLDEIEEDDDEDDDDDEGGTDCIQALHHHRQQQRRERQNAKDTLSKEEEKKQNMATLKPPLDERRRLYVRATMQVLPVFCQYQTGRVRTLTGQDFLLNQVCQMIKPPIPPCTTKVILRRAPTQEEFFRGSLTRNPVPVSILGPGGSDSAGSSGGVATGGDYEATVADLRQHIANDLQMADSAELIELVVANKIVDVSLSLRVINSTLWRRHCIENGGGGSSYSLGGVGSALSIILTDRTRVTEDTPDSSLPPIMIMYRLAGVDGEATEDTVSELTDPNQAAAQTPEQKLAKLEMEYGLTRLVNVNLVLRCVQCTLAETLRCIRRDGVGLDDPKNNPSKVAFQTASPCPALQLLQHCCQLSFNRRQLLACRAPTVLLTLLLDVLKVVTVTANPTADALQDLIEGLTSDISESSAVNSGGVSETNTQDAAAMPLLLQSIETISLTPPLRNVVCKLLPFLTYGHVDISRELAKHFNTHIGMESLQHCDAPFDTLDQASSQKQSVLTETFVQTAKDLPVNDVCNSLRLELVNCGFVDRLCLFILKGIPKQPAPWSPALWSKRVPTETGTPPSNSSRSKKKAKKTNTLEDTWQEYYSRGGIRPAFSMLTGLCRKHIPTQARMAMFAEFVQSCHWLENTSDSTSVKTNGIGLLSETLLDEMVDGNEDVKKLVKKARQKTRLRKKELAQERRNKMMAKVNAFGQSTAVLATSSTGETNSGARVGFASLLAPVAGLFQSGPSNSSTSSKTKTRRGKNDTSCPVKPAWLAEAELMEDETGLTCAVCQEGRTLQPAELLGMYAYVKKVTISTGQPGVKAHIDGTTLLEALPSEVPESLVGTVMADEWFHTAKAAANNLKVSVSESRSGLRNSVFTTTVSAGNGIHLNCHKRARQADRSHPKAPKSEWEGAALRNNRVSCNLILPLVSSHSSKVPLIAVESALTDYHSAVSNLLGSTPKSTMWTVLHDVRFLLLRMAYGESLSSDCGGGSLVSNCSLLYYQFLMVDMFDKDAQVDKPEQSLHARALPSALLAGTAIIATENIMNGTEIRALTRGVADAAPMAAMNCIIFHNTHADGMTATNESMQPHTKRQWRTGRDYFLQGLLICAGRRHALGQESSGCQSSRSRSRPRASSFAEWDDAQHGGDDRSESTATENDTSASRSVSSGRKRRRAPSAKSSVEDFSKALRPMITLFAIFDHLSDDFGVAMDDVQVESSAQRLASTVEQCQRCKNIYELFHKAKVTLDCEDIMTLLQKGMVAAC